MNQQCAACTAGIVFDQPNSTGAISGDSPHRMIPNNGNRRYVDALQQVPPHYNF
jgi:hypothetical protein